MKKNSEISIPFFNFFVNCPVLIYIIKLDNLFMSTINNSDDKNKVPKVNDLDEEMLKELEKFTNDQSPPEGFIMPKEFLYDYEGLESSKNQGPPEGFVAEAFQDNYLGEESSPPLVKSNTIKIKSKSTEVKAVKNIDEKNSYNALELYHFQTAEVSKLLDPFLQTFGLASLVGTSESGKSTFLRQLSLSIVLKTDKFLGFKLHSKYNKVIYVSTEDDSTYISYALRKQVTSIKKEYQFENLDGLKNLEFIFDTTDLYKVLSDKLKTTQVDLIIIDVFSDVFTKEINSNTQVRSFLNSYDQLAKKHQCLIMFLHHIGKRTNYNAPSKDSIIGSQGFEAKMRSVLELRPNFNNDSQIDLWVLKSNFLEAQHKKNSYVLNFSSSDLMFTNTGRRGSKQKNANSNNTALITKVMKLHKQGLSSRKIEDELKNTDYKISKSAAAEIIKKNKKNPVSN